MAIIGSGATTVFLLRHLYNHINIIKSDIQRISIFEKDTILGMGMPYNPRTTDRYNLANISSEEIPKLNETFAEWLGNQKKKVLDEFDISKTEVSKSEVYSRLALGAYFRSQYEFYVERIKNSGIDLEEFPSEEIVDLQPQERGYKIISKSGNSFKTNKVIIATGHVWKEEDNLKRNFFASPWPISKIIPDVGKVYDHPIGILGASLSAFDVVSSLSHRHGKFITRNGQVVFEPFEGTENFMLILHDANGWLPHLQYEQAEPMRQIYRHIDRNGLMELLDEHGYLRINTFFDIICKPALQKALRKDNLNSLAELLDHSEFGMEKFVERMSERHEYKNAFEGMRAEMVEAKNSVQNGKPIHWKEVIDDLMYCLNYHSELMPAEDHLFFHKVVMPFLMNVIAALPLSSGKILLALYDAGKLKLRSGLVKIVKNQPSKYLTRIELTNGDKSQNYDYKMFISCEGQKNIGLEDYPFPSLIKRGMVRPARALIKNKTDFNKISEVDKSRLLKEGKNQFYLTGGIDIDAAYRIINRKGNANEEIYDVSFTHSSGVRPYSYGLQACSATTEIMVESWVNSIKTGGQAQGELTEVTKVYRDNPNL